MSKTTKPIITIGDALKIVKKTRKKLPIVTSPVYLLIPKRLYNKCKVGIMAGY